MSYEIGTEIKLDHLNKKGDFGHAKKLFQEAICQVYEVGTQIRFTIKDGQTKAARRIPVVFV